MVAEELALAHGVDGSSGVKIKTKRPNAKDIAVYGSRTHDFCLSVVPELLPGGRAAS
jgi:hypothetical protein